MPSEALYYNAALLRLQGPSRTLRDLYKRHRSWQRVWDNLSTATTKQLSPLEEWEKLKEGRVELILIDDNRYPSILREIPWPPLGLYVKGEIVILEGSAVALVGTRKATREGITLAEDMATEIAQAGLVVVSGLALGIDGAAHRGCLKGRGRTIAVLAGGLDRPYPRLNAQLAEEILKGGGALVSEYPLGTPALPHQFLERNRIVSGLSKGVVIVEAPSKSGALVTARFALEQGRDVYVLPGPARHPHFEGSHALIREGAVLVTTAYHILEALQPQLPIRSTTREKSDEFSLTAEEGAVLKILKKRSKPASIQEIINETNLEAKTVSQTVSYLLLKGALRETEEGYSI